MEAKQIVHRMRNDLYCCYRHFMQGRNKNEQTHCYGHVVKGLILPEGIVGAELKRKLSQTNLMRTAKQQDNDQMQIRGKGIALREFGTDVKVDGVKPSLPQHLSNPFIYCDKVYDKGGRPATSLQEREKFLVAAETSCRKHLKHDLQIEQQLKGLTKQQRREFFSRAFNLTESLYNFYAEIQKCLEGRLYERQQKGPSKDVTLASLLDEYCKSQGIDLSKRHDLIMFDEGEFKGFIRSLGFPAKQLRLIDQFWELVFREGIFQNYQVTTGTVSNRSLRKTSKVISMKAFLYNYRKFFANRERYVFVFSPNRLRQRLVDLRWAINPWKHQYRLLSHRLRELAPLEFSICQKLAKTNKQLSEDMLQTIEERNHLCFKVRTLAKYYSKLINGSTVTFDGLHTAFLERLQKIRSDMATCEDFLQSFRNFRRELATRQPTFDQFLVKATDIADFLAYSKVPADKAEQIIRWVNKFYKYLHFYKAEDQISYDINTGKLTLTSNLQFSYDELSEFLHYRTAKMEDEQNTVNQFLMRLEQFHQQNIEGLDISRSKDIFEQNVVAEFFLREVQVDLSSFEKLLAIVKVGSLHEEEEAYGQQTVHEIEQFLSKRTASQHFSVKFLFGDQVVQQTRRCVACNTAGKETEESEAGVDWRDKIQHGRKLFSEQLDSLQHVLLDWNTIAKQSAVHAYPNVKCVRTQQVRIEEPAQLVEEEQKHRDFRIKYVEVPKEKIYKVQVIKHEPVSAQSAIFQEENKPQKPKSEKSEQQQESLHNCPLCSAKFPSSHLSIPIPTSSYPCSCDCISGASYRTYSTESDSTIRSVADMQDQLLRLLNI